MTKTKIAFAKQLQASVIKLCRIHFCFIAIYAVYTIASDATHLITPKFVLQRWSVNAIMLVGVSIVWYLARNDYSNSTFYRTLVYVLILLDIFMASFNVYTQRGMASRAVILFCIPIVISTVLLSRTALFMTAALSTATYSLSAVKYFIDFFNEGYKAELYIEVGFYCATFFILATFLSLLLHLKNNGFDTNL